MRKFEGKERRRGDKEVTTKRLFQRQRTLIRTLNGAKLPLVRDKYSTTNVGSAGTPEAMMGDPVFVLSAVRSPVTVSCVLTSVRPERFLWAHYN